MIVIYTNQNDATSDLVQDWLTWYGYDVKRINNFPIDFDNLINISIGKFAKNEDNNVHGSDTVWFRRWNNRPEKTTSIQNAIDNEHRVLKNYLNVYCDDSFVINKPSDLRISKIDMLKTAHKVGLDIPETIITSSKAALLNFYEIHEKIIVKPLSDPLILSKRKTCFASYTRLLCKEEVEVAEPLFLPSLFQEYIEKKFEIRAFLLNKEFYCMAIFSQMDDRTAIDYRHYRPEKANRQVPFKLPLEIQDKLLNLMEALDLESGSIDIVFDTLDRYVFLEVNPVGQFGMVSQPCNYYLEKRVAEHIIERYDSKVKATDSVLL